MTSRPDPVSTVLVTGFEPFGDLPLNPTERLVADLADTSVPGLDVRTALLPVTYDGCLAEARRVVEEMQPDAVLCLGLAAGRAEVTPERRGVNLQATGGAESFADNAGDAPTGRPVVADGPDELGSTLPVDGLVQALVAAGVPAHASDSAGTYICNTTLYGLLHDAVGTGRRVGFVHVPASHDLADQRPELPSLPHEVLLRAVVTALEVVRDA